VLDRWGPRSRSARRYFGSCSRAVVNTRRLPREERECWLPSAEHEGGLRECRPLLLVSLRHDDPFLHLPARPSARRSVRAPSWPASSSRSWSIALARPSPEPNRAASRMRAMPASGRVQLSSATGSRRRRARRRCRTSGGSNAEVPSTPGGARARTVSPASRVGEVRSRPLRGERSSVGRRDVRAHDVRPRYYGL